MKLNGVVTNVTAFGVFVDIGVHQDGLVHVSQLADRFVRDPHQVVKVHQRVNVTVLEVDLERRRISLSLKKDPAGGEGKSQRKKGSEPVLSPTIPLCERYEAGDGRTENEGGSGNRGRVL